MQAQRIITCFHFSDLFYRIRVLSVLVVSVVLVFVDVESAAGSDVAGDGVSHAIKPTVTNAAIKSRFFIH